jgi:O-acetyl-ADP-ribose deacetylase (regulator of RNase III)
MHKIRHSWDFHNLKLRLVTGDMFELNVASVVNSEQSDFILAPSTSETISGGINRHCGDIVQQELMSLMNGNEVLPEGTVLTTSGGEIYEKVFHIGFHYPDAWLDPDDYSHEADYIDIIAGSIREVLECFGASNLPSIAFPLVGCGLFDLSPRMLAYTFISTVCDFQENVTFEGQREVNLVVYDEDLTTSVIDAFLQAMIDRNTWQGSPEFLLGIPYIDHYANKCLRGSNDEWLSWKLCKFAELVLNFELFTMAYQQDLVRPEDLFEEGRPASFGSSYQHALRLASGIMIENDDETWGSFFAEGLTKTVRGERPIARVIADRNAIAHGRKAREYSKILRDVKLFLGAEDWSSRLLNISPPITLLPPWIIQSPKPDEYEVHGIFDKWFKNSVSYVIPHTGEVFRISIG